MKISYNWLKSYIPEIPTPEKLSDIFTFHICEVESFDMLKNGDYIFDLKILPNRAHDLLSHQGVARELASLLNIQFIDPTSKYKIPESKETKLEIKIETDKCRRYMGRVVRNVTVSTSPKWMVDYLESIGQRSINNLVDAANILMYDIGQPAHVFDLDKVSKGLIIRQAVDGEKMTTLDNRNLDLTSADMVVADHHTVLGLAGIKGGKVAEVNNDTKNVIIEIANFDPVATRKSGQRVNIFTDARKRFENEISAEFGVSAMRELSALIFEICPEAIFENIIDIYPIKQKNRTVEVSVSYINKRLGTDFSKDEISAVWTNSKFVFAEEGGLFKIEVPSSRIDLMGPHDFVEDLISVLGFDRLTEKLPTLKLESKVNETYKKMSIARNHLLNEGYSEVMTYVFQDKGEVEVLASASDKKFLRTNLADGLKESLKLNKLNAPLLGLKDIKIFEIGTVFLKGKEEMHVAYNKGNDIVEDTLENFYSKLGNEMER
jgi:phenylalanyl-tRNA synthetase beta chain